jgi:hypothetical protein
VGSGRTTDVAAGFGAIVAVGSGRATDVATGFGATVAVGSGRATDVATGFGAIIAVGSGRATDVATGFGATIAVGSGGRAALINTDATPTPATGTSFDICHIRRVSAAYDGRPRRFTASARRPRRIN